MYQATAMKLQQQKHSAKIALEESKLRVMRNEPPQKTPLMSSIDECNDAIVMYMTFRLIKSGRPQSRGQMHTSLMLPMDLAYQSPTAPLLHSIHLRWAHLCAIIAAKLAGYYFLVGKKKILSSLTKPSWIPTTSSHSTYLATQIDVQKRPEEPSRCRCAFVEV